MWLGWEGEGKKTGEKSTNALLHQLLPCCEVVPFGCHLNLTYVQPTAKNLWSHFFSCAILSSAFPSLAFCLQLCRYLLRLITELIWLKIMLLLGWFSVNFPDLYWHKEGDGSIRLGQDCPFWQQQGLRSAYSSCGSTASKSRSEKTRLTAEVYSQAVKTVNIRQAVEMVAAL